MAGGAAYVWGYGDQLQLGQGDDNGDRMTPVPLPPTKLMKDQRIATISFGGQHAALVCLPPGGAGGGGAGGGDGAKRART
jgi:hypothetical protein